MKRILSLLFPALIALHVAPELQVVWSLWLSAERRALETAMG